MAYGNNSERGVGPSNEQVDAAVVQNLPNGGCGTKGVEAVGEGGGDVHAEQADAPPNKPNQRPGFTIAQAPNKTLKRRPRKHTYTSVRDVDAVVL